MSAFGDGIILGTIDYGGKFAFLFSMQKTAASKFKWETARLELLGSEMPARVPSRADLLKIASYLDNTFGVGVVRHRNSATRQLEAYLEDLAAVQVQSFVSMPVAA